MRDRPVFRRTGKILVAAADHDRDHGRNELIRDQIIENRWHRNPVHVGLRTMLITVLLSLRPRAAPEPAVWPPACCYMISKTPHFYLAQIYLV